MINNVTLMGRLTAAPELKTTKSGTTVTSFCIAIDRRYQPKEGEKQTDFINCIAWRNTAEFITRYFKKGDLIALTGEIQTRKYKDNDGNSRTAFEVVISQASFCGGKNNTDSGNAEKNAYTAATGAPNFEEITDDEELPF